MTLISLAVEVNSINYLVSVASDMRWDTVYLVANKQSAPDVDVLEAEKMGKQIWLTDKSQIVMVRWLSQSVSKTTGLVWYSCYIVVRT